jgi:hypothetical protein
VGWRASAVATNSVGVEAEVKEQITTPATESVKNNLVSYYYIVTCEEFHKLGVLTHLLVSHTKPSLAKNRNRHSGTP